jgi:hypothetical protein
MMLRMTLMLTALIGALSGAGQAAAEQLNYEAARQFVAGKLFAFTCFEGTRGAGRIYGDGSVAGSIQLGGSGPVRFVTLPAGTVRPQGDQACASVNGIPFQPCFDVDRTDAVSFRGSLSSLHFAYCDFSRRSVPTRTTIRTMDGLRTPLSLHAAAMSEQGEGQ